MAPIAHNGSNGHHAQQPALTNGHSSTNGASHAIPIVDPTAARRPVEPLKVNSPNVQYTAEHIKSKYQYHTTDVVAGSDGTFEVTPREQVYEFQTQRKVNKTGLMLVGWGGNNGTTVTATILANRHNISWNTRDGQQNPNYVGSLVRASTLRLGSNPTTGKDVNIPFSDVLPMVHPNDLVLGGWDISGMPLDKAMRRSKVLEWDLQRQLAPLMKDLVPLPSVVYGDFINANQEDRSDNLLPGNDKQVHLEKIRKDIRDFKATNGLDKVIVLWTANTERYAQVIPGVNDTADNLLHSIKNSHEEIAPSTVFAVASMLEGAPYINGAPQNTFVPGAIELAERERAFIGGDDFKSGQTKVKSVLAEFLVNAGIKPLSIASYNHLGNNDGRNLNAQAQFRSKEISKASVVDDMVEANPLLYKPLLNKEKSAFGKAAYTTEHPDHCVVIKYMPAVGDNKRAIDEYNSELLMGGRNVMCIFNSCEDSLLATPLILDLALLTELLTRIEYKKADQGSFESFYSVLSLLSFMLKAPLVKPGEQVVNALSRQRSALENVFRACLSLQPNGDMELDNKLTWSVKA
ncbi:uncharacterized protein L969DRAFT_88648 [Mixia osmundae IAM 14324]|uniref:Inositol-3-phosphate synthase n=1 Tax=Mixia osmundae (strain CBS 9802 / IAM 14324 / JCM 22182 / KY 12970) TaxID=764103 RepID=G7EAN0_MIXOS|nr:uncharacterized protein L969DRAFT_88648 [Mixia osmundae IAM 14324]KEI38207.1 hypothetical protein L969DRAFT_88648 [Mixia osmundae IAM 14324]GAA99890.1 hypothetical protein E5Q_06593 [Mixia osmundae IAM 14324]